MGFLSRLPEKVVSSSEDCPAQLAMGFHMAQGPGDAWRNQDGMMGLIRGDYLRRRARSPELTTADSQTGLGPRGFSTTERRREIRAPKLCPGISRADALGLQPEPPAWGGLGGKGKGLERLFRANPVLAESYLHRSLSCLPVSCQQRCLQSWEVRNVSEEQD